MAENAPRQLFKHESISRNGNNGNGVEHAQQQEEAVQAGAEAQAALYVGLSAGEAARMGIWVPCSLPQYKGLSILFRVNNPTRVRRDRPTYLEPRELVLARAELGRANKALAEAGTDATPEEKLALTEAVTAATEAVIEASNRYVDDYHARQCQWLSKFVLSFDGWTMTDVPCPHPEDPDSYTVLHEELEDLYIWTMNEGYPAALAASVKN